MNGIKKILLMFFVLFTGFMFNMPELFAQNIGDAVLMGRYKYEKDGKKAPVEWIVLDKKSNGTVLLLTKYAMVANTDNHAYGTPGGMDTRDKIVLLSIRQAERYLNSGKAGIEQYTVLNPIGRKDEARIAPMQPNCSRFSSVTVTFAPVSSKSVGV